jgi:hypothetical protein
MTATKFRRIGVKNGKMYIRVQRPMYIDGQANELKITESSIEEDCFFRQKNVLLLKLSRGKRRLAMLVMYEVSIKPIACFIMGEKQKAKKYFQPAYAIRKQLLGPEHPNTKTVAK